MQEKIMKKNKYETCPMNVYQFVKIESKDVSNHITYSTT